MALSAFIPLIAKLATDAADAFLPEDPEDRRKAEMEIQRRIMDREWEIEQAAASVVKTEAASKHWLAANWRPLLMLTFGGLIVARWFGFAAPELSEAEYLALWDIVELGIGGYVVGRSAEKIAPGIADAIKKR